MRKKRARRPQRRAVKSSMAEFDFDELDKAVNDLMANVSTSKRNTALDDPEDKILTLSEPAAQPPKDDKASAPTEITPAAAPAVSAAVAASTPVSFAAKRRGQFMDIMAPTAQPQVKESKPVRVSRQGVAVQPAPTSTRSEVKMGVDIKPATPKPAAVTETSAVPVEKPAPVATVEPTPVIESTEMSEPELITEPAPLTTPFLPDTKVEKRPLGSNTSSSDATGEPLADTEVKVEDAPVAVELPAELSGDVLAVESNDLTRHIEAELKGQQENSTVSQEVVVDKATNPDVPLAVTQNAPAEIAPANVETAPPQAEANEPVQDEMSSARASIMQQYTEQPSTGDQSSGSIYDTATYHQAIQPDATTKKHSPVKWVILIIILLVIGAAGGAAAFYFTR